VSGKRQAVVVTRHYALGTRHYRAEKSKVRWFKVLNIEQQNKEPQNIEVKNIISLL